MKTRTYTIALELEVPDRVDPDELDRALEHVVENSTAREAIELGLSEAADELLSDIDVASFRMGIANGVELTSHGHLIRLEVADDPEVPIDPTLCVYIDDAEEPAFTIHLLADELLV